MYNISEKYLELLKAALWGGNELMSEGVNELMSERINELTSEGVNEVIRLAAFQGTGPLVYDQLLKMPEVEIPAELCMQMKQQCVSTMMQQQRMAPLLTLAWKALEQSDIHPVLLKGAGLAQYYPQPHLRQWGDIDLYVGQENFIKACDILRKTFPDSIYGEKPEEGCKHYNFDFPGTAIETHRISMGFAHPCDRRYYEHLEKLYLTKNGPSFDYEGLSITTPEETFNVFFTFLHAWHHFEGSGMNMKQVCDVAVLLHTKRDVIDRARLREMLIKLHLMEVWQLFMYIIANYLGLPKNECPFYTDACQRRAEWLFERVLAESTARRSPKMNAEGASYLKRKWITFQSRMADTRLVRPYAPKYAWHKMVGDVLHGVERTMRRK